MNFAKAVAAGSVMALLLGANAHAQERASTVKPKRPTGTVTTPPRTPPPPDRTRDLVTPPRVSPPPREREPEAANEAPPADLPAASSAAPAEIADASVAEAPATSGTKQLRRELLVASKDVSEADEQRNWLLSQGAQLLRRRSLANLGWVITVYRLAPGVTPAAVATALRQQWPDAMPEGNERYQVLGEISSAVPVEYARELVGWPDGGCGRRPRIAMLDGPVNGALPAFTGRRIEAAVFTPASGRPDYNHGTAVAALLVGNDAPRGLLPGAELMVGVIMLDDDGKAYTTTEWILRGLDWVLGLSPAPVALNLSFGGPRSEQVALAMKRVLATTRVIAAAGNDGKRTAVFPAGVPGVIGVSALDARLRRWPMANTGEHIAIAAPGVDVWTVDGAGRGYYASGTSFATAFVTAAVALFAPSDTQIDDWLARHTRDLGAPRRDRDYGYGILALDKGCQS
jgi:hypothetical protein